MKQIHRLSNKKVQIAFLDSPSFVLKLCNFIMKDTIWIRHILLLLLLFFTHVLYERLIKCHKSVCFFLFKLLKNGIKNRVPCLQ